jgi:hypothetical protein
MGLATASLVIRAFVVKHPAGAAEEVGMQRHNTLLSHAGTPFSGSAGTSKK